MLATSTTDAEIGISGSIARVLARLYPRDPYEYPRGAGTYFTVMEPLKVVNYGNPRESMSLPFSFVNEPKIQDVAAPPPPSAEVVLLSEIRDLLKSQHLSLLKD